MTGPRWATWSNDPVGEAASRDLLWANESAVRAVVAGFFASAGADPGVLLGPLSILVAGVGTGARAFDGRLRQPGLGQKRPRGFVSEQEIPPAASFAVPCAILAAALAQAYDGQRTLGPVLKAGVDTALRAGAGRRAEVLRKLGGGGALAFADPSLKRAILHAAGSSAGGLLTPTDLSTLPSGIDRNAVARTDLSDWFECPWAGVSVAPGIRGSQRTIVVGAIDGTGGFAAAAYARVTEGIHIDDLELVAPKAAEPVRRGLARIAPGTELFSPVPVAIRIVGGVPVNLVIEPDDSLLSREHIERPRICLSRDRSTRQAHVDSTVERSS